jgi:hypothetical protein
VSVRYEYVPKAAKARRYLVAELTPRASAMGLMHGDVIEVHPDGLTVLLRAQGHAPPRKLLDSLIVSGTLQQLGGVEAED